MITIWLATTNSHKVKEIVSAFATYDSLSFKTLRDLKNYHPPEETGTSFKDNAEIKSCYLLKFLQDQNLLKDHETWILGEDSGLEVEALNGDPGIFSARYGGKQTTDEKNNQLLLQNLKNKTNRQAQYVCALSCLSHLGEKWLFQGRCKGRISLEMKGNNGFGYDPLFIPEGARKTLGELPSKFKEKISHRMASLREFKKILSN